MRKNYVFVAMKSALLDIIVKETQCSINSRRKRGEWSNAEPTSKTEVRLQVAMINQINKVSLNLVARLTNPKTKKLKGIIAEHEVVTLIEPATTHNYLIEFGSEVIATYFYNRGIWSKKVYVEE